MSVFEERSIKVKYLSPLHPKGSDKFLKYTAFPLTEYDQIAVVDGGLGRGWAEGEAWWRGYELAICVPVIILVTSKTVRKSKCTISKNMILDLQIFDII